MPVTDPGQSSVKITIVKWSIFPHANRCAPGEKVYMDPSDASEEFALGTESSDYFKAA